ncbi:Hypothetical predicted protein [Cloeon dipterum]|uniref:ZAD domain-containing protein n=1 Tax=Cloeon dipterum TaxID=197152 RepID=A0A8S1DHN7_9INSE|nr:Hypothetical predicted protein [Cloeon dipterum]
MAKIELQDMCRICGTLQEDATKCLSLSRLPPEKVKNWLLNMFNESSSILDKEGSPNIICSECTSTAKDLHKFIAKCYELNGNDLPKQDWWNNIKTTKPRGKNTATC